MERRCDVAAYVWPSYTGDDLRARQFWSEGEGEWETVRRARAKFPGHDWPRRPSWGCVNEADPQVMRMQIDVALDHGVNVFLYDWYWYDGRPFLETCLDRGFLRAPNRRAMRFALMWANHDATNLWDRRRADDPETVVWRGAVDRAEFDRVADAVLAYMREPNYYRVDGRPVFLLYDTTNLVRGLGGLDPARDALDAFRARARADGHPDLHLVMVAWGERVANLTGVDGDRSMPAADVCRRLGFDAATHYQYVHFTNIKRTYAEVLPDVVAAWDHLARTFPVPYYPHVSLGWDNNPRHQAVSDYILRDPAPERIRDAFAAARDHALARPGQAPLVTVNSWNEWTESSYLQPDDLRGYGYLEAARDVFGPAPREGQGAANAP